MQELFDVTGMILRAEPVGEYDKRLVILTAESGKITCFAKGARRQGNRFMASTDPFCFGNFRLFPGRNTYSLNEARILNYFAPLREDYERACYGMFFLELSDYYTVENNDEKPMLKLLYRSVEALFHESIPKELVRCVFELKALCVNGEYPGIPEPEAAGLSSFDPSTEYTMRLIETTDPGKLYHFTVSEKVLGELRAVCDLYRRRFIGRTLKSLEILDTIQ
ncbi:MAG: DNA repair protein RecO [Lachnospiraceae bacterium]|nr:DNA repair protein RecO [Lachnospiraceae bacterium]